ncbi:MAG: hypothetical protein ILA34_08155 [Bacteroidaceae bacterium]|nr:hypothetical protein [Bacteroidaceae bacterium]
MKRTYILLTLITLLTQGLAAQGNRETVLSLSTLHQQQRPIVICGDDKIRIIDPEKSDSSHTSIQWEWTAGNILPSGIPSSFYSCFQTMDECKPVANNTQLLVTSSSGGAAVIEIATKKCLFYARTPNAHSIEQLPNNRIAVAMSTSSNTMANSVCIYQLGQNNSILYRDTLYFGHGVVWNATTERLYALGSNELRAYKLTNWDTDKPSLTLDRIYNLPVSGCHDLSRISDRYYLITAAQNVYLFDTSKGSANVYPSMMGHTSIKSINLNPLTGQIIYTEPEESWWTFHVKSINPEWSFPVPDQKVYKVRVFQ